MCVSSQIPFATVRIEENNPPSLSPDHVPDTVLESLATYLSHSPEMPWNEQALQSLSGKDASFASRARNLAVDASAMKALAAICESREKCVFDVRSSLSRISFLLYRKFKHS